MVRFLDPTNAVFKWVAGVPVVIGALTMLLFLVTSNRNKPTPEYMRKEFLSLFDYPKIDSSSELGIQDGLSTISLHNTFLTEESVDSVFEFYKQKATSQGWHVMRLPAWRNGWLNWAICSKGMEASFALRTNSQVRRQELELYLRWRGGDWTLPKICR